MRTAVRPSRTLRRAVLPASLALALAGCEPGGPVGGLLGEAARGRLAVGDELLVAGIETGETCRAVKVGEAGTLVRLEDIELRCGSFEEPAGRLRRFPIRAGEDLSPFLERRELALWDAPASACGPLERRSVGAEVEVLVRRCTDADGWPMLALAARSAEDRRAIAGAVLPQLVPVIEQLLVPGAEPASLRRGGRLGPLAELARATDAAGRPLRVEQITDQRRLAALGRAFDHAGRFAEAVRAHERALVLQRAAQGPEAPATATTLAALGLNLALDGRTADARTAFERAGRLVERAPGQDRRARYLLYRAAFARREGDLGAARAMAEEAVRLREAAYGADAAETAQARATLGGVLADRGDTAQARRLLEGALAVLERERERTGQLFARARLAALERTAGRPAAARGHARLALAQSRALFGDGPTTIGLLVELGRIERAAGRAEAALGHLDEAARLAEAALADGYRHPEEAIAAHLGLLLEEAERRPAERPDLLARAWRVAQLAPASRLADVERRAAGRLAAADAGLGERARALQETDERLLATTLRLGRLRLEDARAPSAERAAALEAERADLLARRRALEREIQARFPRYGALTAPRVVPVEEAAALLAPDEAIVRLVVTPEASFALALGADRRIAAHRTPLGTAAIRDSVGRLRAGLGFAAGTRPFDRATAQALHAALLAPLADALEGRDHLLLVPDGPLQGVPLGVLLVADGPQPRWLAAERAISVLPAVASLPLARRQGGRVPAPEPFLGVGDPVLAGGSGARSALAAASGACREDEPLDPRLLRSLPPLPETALELRRVARALGAGGEGTLLLGAEAREPVIRRLPLGRYRVIAFATHGLLPGELRCASEPALVLTPPARPGPADDGLLSASEIALLELDAEWVSLSACNTAASGGPGGGEALGGLAGAFLRAGARRVLASHWEVDSDATVALMTATFASYGREPGAGAARALRAAQRKLQADPRLAHPSYWAAFTLLGDGGGTGPAFTARARP